MTIRLSKDLEQFVHDAVKSGNYAGEDDVIRDALTRLKQQMPSPRKTPAPRRRPARQAEPKQNPISPEELNQRLLADGLVVQLPDPSQDADDDEDLPIEIQGEPLSETIIRERR